MRMPTTVVKTPAMISTSHIEMWIPAAFSGAVERKWKVTCSKCPEANHPAVYAPAA